MQIETSEVKMIIRKTGIYNKRQVVIKKVTFPYQIIRHVGTKK